MTVAVDPRHGYWAAGPKWRLLLAGAAVAAILLVRAGRRWTRNPLRWPVLALLAWTAVSAVTSRHHHVALVGFPGSYDGLWTALALAVVFFAAAAFRREEVRPAVGALWFVAGPAVVGFGVVQLVTPGPGAVDATFGNPNDLAGFLAVVLPLGVVLAILGGRRARVASALLGTGLVVELAVTSSRGGLVAAAAGLAVLAVLLRAELRPHRALVVRLAAAALAVLVVAAFGIGVAGGAKRDVGGLVRVGRGSTADLRLQVWAIGLRIAADHPVTGVGPDAFGVAFPAYSTPRFRTEFGPFTVANGAHNVFVNTLADLGVVGLAAFLAVLVVGGVRIARTWRRLPADTEDRLLLAGIAAALVAYVVQACANMQELSLSTCFWALLGLAVALSAPATGTAPTAGRA